MQYNICYILSLFIYLNTFGQDFKEQYHRYYPDAGDTITVDTNQYGFKTKQGKLSELVVKTVTESTFSKGVQGYYKNGKKHGFWRYSYDTSIIESGYYKQDKPHGVWLIEGPDNDMQPTKIYYKNGVKIKNE